MARLQGSRHPGPENTERQRQRGRKKGKKKQQKRRKRKKKGGGWGDNKTPRPNAPRAPKQGTLKTKGANKRKGKQKKKKNHSNKRKQGSPSMEGAEQKKSAPRPATGKGEADQNALGRLARLTRPRVAHTRTHARDPGVASYDPKGAVSASTRSSPGAPAGSPVERRVVRESRRVSDRIHMRQPTESHFFVYHFSAKKKCGWTPPGGLTWGIYWDLSPMCP